MKTSRKSSPSSEGTLLQDVRRRLQSAVDPAYYEQIAVLIGTRDGVMGVRVPKIRATLADIVAQRPGLTPDDAIALMDQAARSTIREEMLIATFMLAKFRRKLPPTLLDRIDRWIDSVNNWETCDQLAMNVAAPLVARYISEIDRLITWAGSSNPWRRRFALATAAALNQKGRKFPRETLQVCEVLITDEDASVRKAIGWAIREACDSDESLAVAFLRRHAPKMHPTVLREASKKLPQSVQATVRQR